MIKLVSYRHKLQTWISDLIQEQFQLMATCHVLIICLCLKDTLSARTIYRWFKNDYYCSNLLKQNMKAWNYSAMNFIQTGILTIRDPSLSLVGTDLRWPTCSTITAMFYTFHNLSMICWQNGWLGHQDTDYIAPESIFVFYNGKKRR